MGGLFPTACGWGSLPRQPQPATSLFSRDYCLCPGSELRVGNVSFPQRAQEWAPWAQQEPNAKQCSAARGLAVHMYNHRLLAFEWKTQQRQWENRAGWLKGHHPVTLDSKALIKIKCVLQTYKRRECECTLCRRRNKSAATNDLVSLCNCSETVWTTKPLTCVWVLPRGPQTD